MRILVTGASGQLGGYLLRELRRREKTVIAWSGSRSGSLFGYTLRQVDLADKTAISAAFREAGPDGILHSGALASVADCQRDAERARMVNTLGSAMLAELAEEAAIRLVSVSTDLVFDGLRGGYREEDAVSPLSTYGRTKAAAEQAVLAYPGAAVVRVPLLFGPSLIGRPTFFDQQTTALREGRSLALFHDEWRTPLDFRTAALALIALLETDYVGLLHVGGPERLSRIEMGRRLAASLRCDPAAIVAVSRDSTPAAEPRPCDTSLDCSRWRRLWPQQPWPVWDDALPELYALVNSGGIP
jgi:dTDP-4-dehydrorhamnose reductase